jgi:hypothetical protein
VPALARIIGSRTTPEEIKTALEAIDPNAELIHLQGKRWWLGVRAPNPEAADPMELADAHKAMSTLPTIEDKAERAMMEVELAQEFTMRQIMAEGFKPVALYVVGKGEDYETLHQIVEDFRIRDYNWRTMTPEQQEQALRDSFSMEKRNAPRIKRWGQMAKEAASEAYNFIFRGARSFMLGALNRE